MTKLLSFILASTSVLSVSAFAQGHSTAGIEQEMGRDEQALVSRTIENANNFSKRANKKIKDLDKKISESTGAQKEARIERRNQIQAVNKLVDGCLAAEWNKIGNHRISSAPAVDALIQSLDFSLED